MPTSIAVWRDFSVQPLLEITDPEFAHWYGLGVWWAMYGEQQGNGPYDDQYLIDNLTSHIRAGWYDDPHLAGFQCSALSWVCATAASSFVRQIPSLS
jgi:hypothetical protein